MDIQPQTAQSAQPTKPISDDQELAKVLAGISSDANPNLEFGDTPALEPGTEPAPADNSDDNNPVTPSFNMNPSFTNPAEQADSSTPATLPEITPSSNVLEGIRKDAILELRPLVDKLDLEPEEKFDIYLLLLRSTDDTALIAPAHEAAKNIADETKRAQALLDVIKEIDFLSVPPQTANI